jgi:streptogrisin C
MLHSRATITGTVLAIAALALTATPAVAGPAPAVPQADQAAAVRKPPPGVVEAMQRDLGLTREQAETRLLNEARATEAAPKIRKKLTDDYAGAWLTGKTGTLVVATTDAGKTGAITSSGAQAKVVAHSLAELEAVKEDLDRASDQATQDAPVWYVDLPSNSVVVLATDAAKGAEFVTAAGVDASVVRVEVSEEKPTLFADVRGGDAYYIDNTYRCSVGFSVRRGATPGFVTAGHCGNVGSTTTGPDRTTAQGTFRGSSFPGNDYAWVEVNSNWVPQPVVNGYSAGIINVAGSTQAVVGASICRSGSTTQWRCGTVQQHNTSVRYQEGTVNEVTRTSACAEPGDSGGSFISGSQAQGVTSGGSGNCTIGGTTYYQPVNEILSAYGLTLVTGDGGGGEQPGGCAGHQNTRTGSLTSGQSVYQPDGSYYQTTASGTHSACLDGPDGTDFDLYLQRWNGLSWVNVASGSTAAPDETITYNGAAGYYRYRVHAYSGSGSYTLGYTRP